MALRPADALHQRLRSHSFDRLGFIETGAVHFERHRIGGHEFGQKGVEECYATLGQPVHLVAGHQHHRHSIVHRTHYGIGFGREYGEGHLILGYPRNSPELTSEGRVYEGPDEGGSAG